MVSNHQSLSSPKKDIIVFLVTRPSVCSGCGTELTTGDFLKIENQKHLCLECADLDHLVFLESGDNALTCRSKKYSNLFAVVYKFSPSRKRSERQGLLVESDALARAKKECADDELDRKIARERAAVVRVQIDKKYVAQFSKQILIQYPGCPVKEAESIAKHACQKYSGRVGRSSAAKAFDAVAIALAVRAHIRHVHTDYYQRLSGASERKEARLAIADQLDQVEREWSRNCSNDNG